MKPFFLLVLLFSFFNSLFAQNHHSRFESIDVQHYIFEIHLHDSTNCIEGKTTATIKFLKPAEKFILDLVGSDSLNNGMIVNSVKVEDLAVNFVHKNNELEIFLNGIAKTNDLVDCVVNYSGVPADGLIISKNKYGDRTFFGDNWPNRARFWLPTVDHPSDKATVEFKVLAPQHYKVISNGQLEKVSLLKNHQKQTIWKENVPISTKLMIIGAANFEIGNEETYKDIPVSSWIFPQNKEIGFKNYSFGSKALKYFSELVGTYPYEKLAHVQSKTRYGGMENASCIFYSEQTGFSQQSQERLFAHETAHQWFGNSVTEQNWHHIWLSEGFATYLTHVYNQNFKGEDFLKTSLNNDRMRVIKYAEKNFAPIIDTTITDYNKLLSTNTYQKASWFLHMLRGEIGDSLFFLGLKEYYKIYKDSTALTSDFKHVMESFSNRNLETFFKQWLWQPGHPIIKLHWKQKWKRLKLIVRQKQADYLFRFPIEIEIKYKNGDAELKKIIINNSKTSFHVRVNNEVDSIILDPNVKLLFGDFNN